MTTTDKTLAGHIIGIDVGAPDGVASATTVVFEANADGRLTMVDAYQAVRVTADDIRALTPSDYEYVIEIGTGVYFVDANHPDGGPLEKALRFTNRSAAECYTRAFHIAPAVVRRVPLPDPDIVPLDPACPYCKGPHDVADALDGSERRCASCGRRIVCVVWNDDTASMIRPTPYPNESQLTGRQRTRARWRRRGRGR